MVRSAVITPVKVPPAPTGTCVHCGDPVWSRDPERPDKHPCCVLWCEEWGWPFCEACRTSKKQRVTKQRVVK